MDHLKCNVKNCTFNKEAKCEKNSIVVGGMNAHNAKETCCESFAPAEACDTCR